MSALQLYAGAKALSHIEDNGIKPQDVCAILAASGGPKWFVLSHLDRYLIQHWLPKISHDINLIGSSIGAWRMAAYAGKNPLAAIERLEHDYLHQRYSAKPNAAEITRSVHELLDVFIHPDDLTSHPNRLLNIVAARAKGIAQFESKAWQTAAIAAVALGNLASRKTLPWWFDRAVFQTKPGSLPINHWDQFSTQQIALNQTNYRQALLASGAIPIVIDGVKNPAGATRGMYRDGGMVDYHFDLPIKPADGIVLYPHFMPQLKPGWFDKSLSWRKVSADHYSHTLVVCPSQSFVESLPLAKIPDRKDFERLENDQRIQYWRKVVDRNQALAEAFDNWVNSANPASQVKPISDIALK